VSQVDVQFDSRPRRRRMTPVLATAITGVVGALYLRAVDPNIPGHYPGCPSQMLLGIDCPGCGGMRGTYELLHGNLAGMLEHNILLMAAWPLALAMFIVWFRRSWSGRRPWLDTRAQTRRNRLLVWALVLTVAFGVVRNFIPSLGSSL
jgi:hypothetical protein